MKQFKWPTLSSILFIAVLLLLPGFKTNHEQEPFPAPIENPGIAIYANLSASGLYNQSESVVNTVSEIAEAVASICVMRNPGSEVQQKTRQIAENLINDKLLAGHFKTYEVFFYLRDLRNYSIILNGEFNFSKLSESFPEATFATDAKSFSTRRIAPAPLNEVFINCSADRLVLCHPDNAEEIINRLDKNENLLSDEHKVFKRMLVARPAAAGEISIQLLEANLADFSINHFADGLRHVRVVAASQMTKLQLFIPDSHKREATLNSLNTFIDAGNAILNKFGRFQVESSGNSLFIETASNSKIEKLISSEILAFFLHFFVRAEKNSAILSANFANE